MNKLISIILVSLLLIINVCKAIESTNTTTMTTSTIETISKINGTNNNRLNGSLINQTTINSGISGNPTNATLAGRGLESIDNSSQITSSFNLIAILSSAFISMLF